MLTLSKKQKKHVVKVIKQKRKEFFGYPGGNREMAERLNVSPQLLSMWVNNKRVPSHKDLLVIAEVCNITLGELCNLPERPESERRNAARSGKLPVSQAKAQRSMLEICDITTEIVQRQREMLMGKCDYKKHTNWLRRIKNYVDTI